MTSLGLSVGVSLGPLAGQGGGGIIQALLATGPIGLWMSDQYDSTSKSIPNEVTRSSVALTQNLFRAPRRLFSNPAFWIGGTCVDDAATDPDGGTEASTVSLAAGGVLNCNSSSYSVPAGDYTIKAKVKTNTGSDEQFAFTKDNTATRSSAKTATTGWQSFAYEFTLASPATVNRISLCTVDGSTAADLQVIDMQLFPGTTDIGDEAFGGHINLGIHYYDTRPTYAGGEIDLSTGGYGISQFGSAHTIDTGFTAIVLGRKIAAGSSYHAGLSKVQSYGAFTASMEVAGKAANYSAQPLNNQNLWPTLNDGYHAFGHRHTGTNLEVWLDDVRLFKSANSLSSHTIRDLFAGIVNVSSLYCGYKIAAMIFYDKSLTEDEYRTTYGNLVTYAEGAGL